MVLFSTKFALSGDMVQSEFLEMLTQWIEESPHYTLHPVFDGVGEYDFQSDATGERLLVYAMEDTTAVQFITRDKDLVFTNIYIMTKVDGQAVMFIRLEKSSIKASAQMDVRAKIPRLMRDIFWREYGGFDNGLRTDDKAYVLRKNDVDMAVGMLNGVNNFINPLVYVSPVVSSGKYLVDYEYLASELLGMAHVVVESNPYVAGLVGNKVKKGHPTNGKVVVILPGGEREVFIKNTTMTEDVIDYVRKSLVNVIVEDAFSFSKIRLSYFLSKNDKDNELSSICDEMLSEKDSEIKVLSDRLAKAEQKAFDAEQKALSLNECMKKAKGGSGDSLSLITSEQDLYDNEMKDVVLKILKKEYDGMSGDNKLKASRKYTVLGDILSKNEQTGKADEIWQVFKNCILKGNLSSENIRDLERCGFKVTVSGGGHYKVIFNNDERYQAVISSTASDHRSGKNTVSDYMNLLFGY